ncbi:MAG: 23S rRNA (uracil(1939)-C(5))-methyltransferase RlmD [Deltaproteobacteria bacterium]|nr:23S rRNA (uracil(1939)-C(5))-methyltransferase RlmD [Deltaproteobacteria bacterium]
MKGTIMERSSDKKRPQKTAAPRPPLPEVDILALNEEGIGVGRLGNREVWVSGALPGEKILFAVEHKGQRRIVGTLKRILQPHPERIPAPCPHARVCQGCPLLVLPYPAQLRFKEERVGNAMKRHPSLAALPIEPILPAPSPLGYRTSAKLVFAKERGRVSLGLYRRGSHDVVDIGACPLHHPLLNRVVAVVKEEVERQNIFVYDENKGRGLLRYLLVRVAPDSARAMVTFVTAERNFRELIHLGKWLQRKVPEVVSVHQNINPKAGNLILGRETLKLFGYPSLTTTVGAIRLRISPTSFFQVNHDQAAAIYALTRRWAALSTEENAIDLYCGIGGIALHLARDAGFVLGIESVEEAVRNARDNAAMNDLQNCIFRAGDAALLMADLVGETPSGGVLTLNPPRGGCDRRVLEAAAKTAPRTLIYVSCDPETLARDLDVLSDLGFRAVTAQPVDMFPQTSHVETVVKLTPKTKR